MMQELVAGPLIGRYGRLCLHHRWIHHWCPKFGTRYDVSSDDPQQIEAVDQQEAQENLANRLREFQREADRHNLAWRGVEPLARQTGSVFLGLTTALRDVGRGLFWIGLILPFVLVERAAGRLFHVRPARPPLGSGVTTRAHLTFDGSLTDEQIDRFLREFATVSKKFVGRPLHLVRPTEKR